MKGHSPFYGLYRHVDGHTVGHTIQGGTINSHCLVPIQEWIWLKRNRRSYGLMVLATQAHCETRYEVYTHKRHLKEGPP